MAYNPPNFNGNIFSQPTIELAKSDETFIKLIRHAIKSISYQKLREIKDAASINFAVFQSGYTLTENDVDVLNTYLIPSNNIESAYYLQRLASRIIVNNEALSQLANIAREAMIYQGYLYFTEVNGILKINDGGEVRAITDQDVLSAMALMLTNTSFLDKLKEEIKLF